eukprot:1390542-Alexandrium_andersonii.AAC.1
MRAKPDPPGALLLRSAAQLAPALHWALLVPGHERPVSVDLRRPASRALPRVRLLDAHEAIRSAERDVAFVDWAAE